MQPYMMETYAEIPLSGRQGSPSAMRPCGRLHAQHLAARVERLQQKLRKPVQVVRAKGNVKKRILAQDHLRHARLLNHAAANAEDQPGDCSA